MEMSRATGVCVKCIEKTIRDGQNQLKHSCVSLCKNP